MADEFEALYGDLKEDGQNTSVGQQAPVPTSDAAPKDAAQVDEEALFLQLYGEEAPEPSVVPAAPSEVKAEPLVVPEQGEEPGCVINFIVHLSATGP
jgi:hypothetical protein